MKRALFGLALAAVFSLGAVSPSFAQDSKQTGDKKVETKQEEKKDPAAEEAKKLAEEQKKKTDEYDKEVKDLKKFDGAFTFYQKGKQIFLELPEDKLGKVFLIQAAWATGASPDLQAGDPLSYQAVDAFRWEKRDDSIWLVRPNTRFRWNKNDPLALASERSFPEAILGSFKIGKTNPTRKVMLMDVTNFFYGDLFKLTESVNNGLQGQYMPDREKSGPEKIKSFADNSTVQMSLHFVSPRGGGEVNPILVLLGLVSPNTLEDGRSAPLKVTYNMWYRDEQNYMPREADPRVGYFTQDFFNVDKFLNEDRTQRYINRFPLVKKNPEAAMSEPVKPIVFTIDNSVPPEYRESVRKAVLMWNKAFEPMGFKNAVQVQDQPNDPDYDHADGRYNVIRWTMSEDAGYAVSLFRTDPFDGRILNASITFDANMLAYSMNEHQGVSTPAANAHQRALDVVTRRADKTVSDHFYLFASEKEVAERKLRDQMKRYGWQDQSCRMAYGLAESASFGYSAAKAGGMKVSKEDYAKQYVTDVIGHEVGHCLGLRHNFVASTAYDLDQMDNDNFVADNGVSSSVMDYVPVNVMAMLKGKGHFFTSTVGSYDVWAIRYGYQDIKSSTPLGERPVLSQIASLSTKAGHAYMTDENLEASWDPYIAMFDNGKDPVAYAQKMLVATDRVKNYAIKQLPRQNESFSKRTSLVMSSIGQVFKQGMNAVRFIGGVQSSRDFRSSDPKQKTLAPVTAAEQREALRLVTKSCLSSDSFKLPSNVMMTLTEDGNKETSATWNAPLRDLIGSQQQLMLSMLVSADTIDRISENHFKSGNSASAYKLDEHYAAVLGSVFSEIGQNKNVEPLRRDLQRHTVNVLTLQAGATPSQLNGDAKMLAADSLRRLSARCGSQVANGKALDGMSKAHLRDLKETIDRFLKRTYK